MAATPNPTKPAGLVDRLKYLLMGEKAFSTVPSSRGWVSLIREPFTGAWQRNLEIRRDTVLTFHAVFACITLIAGDVSKIRILHTRRTAAGIWEEVKSSRFVDLLARPNPYQNMMQFIENWLNSKLTRGNAYILKRRNRQGRVTQLFVMDPDRTTVLVSDSGEVFYQFMQDNLSGVLSGGITVPASEVIHDRFNCLFHPLVGLPPIYASGLAATQGLKIQTNSAKFFDNMSRPSGMLTAPGSISDETAERLKASFNEQFGGDNLGKIAVAGDGLKYEAMTLTAEESELVDQLKLSAEIVCSTFHVPKFMVMGDPPSYNNIDALGQQYYSQCLQAFIEAIELCLDDGLDVPANEGLSFDIDQLIRMDSKTQIDALTEGVKGKVYTPNEARLKLNKKPLKGGDDIYLQQQDFPMGTLSERGAPDAPAPTPPSPTPTPAPEGEDLATKQVSELLDCIKKEVTSHENA